MSRLHSGCALLAALLLFAWSSPAVAITLDGVTVDADSKAGIADLTVKLRPPTSSGGPERVTFTDGKGAFRFQKVDPGRYLFEVYQGVTLLYRKVLALSKDTREEVKLRRRPKQ